MLSYRCCAGFSLVAVSRGCSLSGGGGLVSKLCLTLETPWTGVPARFLCPWDFPKQEYLSGLAFLSPGNLPNPGFESKSPALASGF